MEKKGSILHLEDEEDWVTHVSDLLGEEYEIHSASSYMGAVEHATSLTFDLAIVDIDIIKEETYLWSENVLVEKRDHEKGGFDFVQELQSRNILEGKKIIILSGHVHDGDNWSEASHVYNVAGRFDKGDFLDDKQKIKDLVDRIISNRE